MTNEYNIDKDDWAIVWCVNAIERNSLWYRKRQIDRKVAQQRGDSYCVERIERELIERRKSIWDYVNVIIARLGKATTEEEVARLPRYRAETKKKPDMEYQQVEKEMLQGMYWEKKIKALREGFE